MTRQNYRACRFAGPASPNKRQKAQAPQSGSERRVQFRSGAADVQTDDEGRLFANPPFPISTASLRLQQATSTAHKRAIRKGDLDLLYIKSFVKAGSSRSLFTWCAQELPWYKVCWDPDQHQLCMLAAVLEHTMQCWQQPLASREPHVSSFARCHWSDVQLPTACLQVQYRARNMEVNTPR